jgi:uncharacterized protein with NRDE domain
MCLLLAVRRPGELWLGANRDERLDRAWEPPALLVAEPPVLGGRDVTAGGSWLAVNLTAPFVVAVTNARLGAPPGERSRGQLVVDTAAERTLAEAVALVGELDLARYGPFNLLLADATHAFLATNWPKERLERVDASLTAIGNDRLDDPGPRTRIAALQALELLDLDAAALEPALVRLLSDHTGADPFCRHSERYGTVSSTLLRLDPAGVASHRFAAGPPCATPFLDIAVPRPVRSSFNLLR